MAALDTLARADAVSLGPCQIIYNDVDLGLTEGKHICSL